MSNKHTSSNVRKGTASRMASTPAGRASGESSTKKEAKKDSHTHTPKKATLRQALVQVAILNSRSAHHHRLAVAASQFQLNPRPPPGRYLKGHCSKALAKRVPKHGCHHRVPARAQPRSCSWSQRAEHGQADQVERACIHLHIHTSYV